MLQYFTTINKQIIQAAKVHAYNPSTQKAEEGCSQNQGQSRLHSENLSQNQTNKQQQQKTNNKGWENGSVG